MYYLYSIYFKGQDSMYIGCSNNLRRRKDQHNENARNRKSKLGIFLNENKIVLERKDLKVISKFKNRKLALKKEREMVKLFDETYIKLLNDNYTDNCSRKGKANNNNFHSYDWVVIDYKEKTKTKVHSLKKYCVENKLPYKQIHGTSRNQPHSYKDRYKAFKETQWLESTKEEKEKYLNGSFIKEIYKNNLKKLKKRNAKTYIVEFPDGHKEKITNLDQFAKEHNINAGNLHNTIRYKNKKASGYKAYKID